MHQDCHGDSETPQGCALGPGGLKADTSTAFLSSHQFPKHGSWKAFGFHIRNVFQMHVDAIVIN